MSQKKIPRTPEKASSIPEEWREPIRQLIREEIRAITAEVRIVPELAERPPERPRKTKGRGYAGKKKVLPGSNVDIKLFEMFNEFRRQHRLTASEAMEIVLWVFFGRPPLSYQSLPEQEPETTVNKPNIDLA